MRRMFTVLLLVVVFITSAAQATPDLNLSEMTLSELETLRSKIDDEISARYLDKQDSSKEINKKREIVEKYSKWLLSYDNDSLLVDLNSGKSGLSKKCADEMFSMAVDAHGLLLKTRVHHDYETDTYQVKPRLFSEFGDDCQFYPYIDDGWMHCIVGFQNEDSFQYDRITLMHGDDEGPEVFDRYSGSTGFDLQFEKISGERWEYSIITPASGLSAPVSVSFAKDGSIRKETHILTEDEKEAFLTISELSSIFDNMRARLKKWATTGE